MTGLWVVMSDTSPTPILRTTSRADAERALPDVGGWLEWEEGE